MGCRDRCTILTRIALGFEGMDTNGRFAEGRYRMRLWDMCWIARVSGGGGESFAASDGNTAAANSGWTIGADKDWAQPTGDYVNRVIRRSARSIPKTSKFRPHMDFLNRRPARS